MTLDDCLSLYNILRSNWIFLLLLRNSETMVFHIYMYALLDLNDIYLLRESLRKIEKVFRQMVLVSDQSYRCDAVLQRCFSF